MNGSQARTEHLLRLIDDLLFYAPEELVGFANYLNDIALSTKHNYIFTIKDFLEKADKEPVELCLNDYISDLSKYKFKKNGEEITIGCQRNRYFALKRFSEYLYNIGVADDDYMKKVKMPKGSESEKTIQKRNEGYMTEDEVRKLMINLELDIMNSEGEKRDEFIRDRAMFYVFLTTGIRRNALIALDVSSIDIDKKTMIITDKGRKVRIFNLNDDCVESLMDYLEVRKKYVKNGEEAFFVHKRIHQVFGEYSDPTYERIRPVDIDTLVKNHTAFTGKKLSTHKLRATFGTQLYNKTKDIYFVQKCMGHTNPQITERYIRGEDDMSKKAADIISDLF